MARFRSFLILTLVLLARSAWPAQQVGDQVVVIYNPLMPGSKMVADHYVQLRDVPTNQVLGLPLTTNEDISRTDYTDQLEKPLLRFLNDQKLLTFEPDTHSTNVGARKVKDAKIRYIVLCYGVPLRIANDYNLKEAGADRWRAEFRKNGAAVDSELCLLPWPNPRRTLAGIQPNPFYGATNRTMFSPSNGILIVARLDGPTAEIANALVDKAMEAETNGLWGRAYFDLRGLEQKSPFRKGDDWLGGAAAAAMKYGYETVIDYKPETFSMGFPMSQTAIYMGWYDYNVSGPFLGGRVEFMPGAFAYHLQSYSAKTLRNANTNWCGPLLADGAAATMGCVDEPYLDGTPNMTFFFTRWLIGWTFGEAAYASQEVLSWQTTVIGDPLYRPFGKDPRKLHEFLQAKKSPMVAWSHLRVVDLSLAQGVSPTKLVGYIRDADPSAQSAVLTEKLGDLYAMLGDDDLAIKAWQHTLEIHSTLEQGVRVAFKLGDKFISLGHDEQALDFYDDFLWAHPNYPDALALYKKLQPLAEKAHSLDKAKHYAQEIELLTAAQNKPVK